MGFVSALLFLLVSDQFLAPPDCASYWAWAIAPSIHGTLNFLSAYEQLEMPVRYVALTPTGLLSNDWPPGAGLVLWPTAWAGPAVSHGWILIGVAAVLAAWRALLVRRRWDAGAIWMGLGAMILGTPVAFYGAFAPFFSHTVSFAFVALTVVVWDRTRTGRTVAGWWLLGILTGVAAVVRPQNLALGILPTVESARILLRKPGWRRLPWSGWAGYVGGLIVGIMPLLVCWQVLYGTPFALPKVEEMRWLNPAVVQTLLSDFHGVIPWTPVHALAGLGLIMLIRRDWVLGVGLGLLGAVQLYVNAANEVWWAGGSFGNRRLSDYGILVGYGVAALMASTGPGGWRRWASAGTVLVCCAWTCLLVVMERRGFLPLGRYYPMDGRFWSDAVRTLLEPGEALRVLVGPLLRAWAAAQGQAQIVHGWAPTVAPVAGSGPLLARITGAVLLGVLIPLVWIGGNRLIWQLRKRSLALAVLSGGLSLLVALVLAVAGVRSRPIREVDPELAAKLPAQSLILWDNMLELALYELVRNRPDLALAAADRALEMRPEAYQGWWYRAAALRDLGRLDEARVAARRVLEKEPRHVHALQLLRGVGP